MADTDFIRTLGLIVVSSAALVLVGRRFGVPSIITSMLAGFLLGPVLGVISQEVGDATGSGSGPDSLALVSELGIVLLLFLVGLELSLDEVREVGPLAVVAALVQSAVTGGIVFGLSLAFGLSTSLAVILAIAMGFSSTVVVVKQLEDRGELGRYFGRASIAILLVQDLLVIIVLTVLAGVGRAAGTAEAGTETRAAAEVAFAGGAAPAPAGGAATHAAGAAADAVPAATDAAGDLAASGLDPAAVAIAIVRAFALMVILLGLTFVCARLVLPPLFARLGRSPAAGLLAALAWCFLLVELAHLMGLSVEIGAFLAGMGLGSMPHRSDLQRRVKPLMAFFIAIFFASLGARIDFGDLQRHWPFGLTLIGLVLLLKLPLFAWLARRMGADGRTSVDIGITLMQISEFSLILAAAALAVPGLLGPDDRGPLSMLGVVALVTMIVSVVAMNGRARIHRVLGTADDSAVGTRVDEVPGREDDAAPGPEDGDRGHGDGAVPSGHVIVVGMNPMGRRLVRELADRGEHVVAVDTDAEKLAGLPGTAIRGDVDDPATRAEAGLATARLAICALRIEDANRLFVHRCRAVGVPCVAHAFDRSLAAVLRSLEPAYVIDSKGAADRRIADLIESEAGVAIVDAPRIDDAADAAAGDAAGATDGGATDGGAAAGPGPAPDVRSPGSGACSP